MTIDAGTVSREDIENLLISLMRSNRLSHPLEFDGVVYTPSTAVPAALQTPIYGADGWSFNTISDLGGLRSFGVDAAVAEAIRLGYPDAAKMVPLYHLSRYNQAPERAVTWAVREPNRFDVAYNMNPSFTEDKRNQLQDNLIKYDNWLFSLVGMMGHAAVETFARSYRGEPNRSGFAPVNVSTGLVDFSPANPPGYVPDKLDLAKPHQLEARKYKRVYHPTVDGSVDLTSYTAVAEPGDYSNHYIYDLWWDTRTDDHVTRYWRNWLQSVGVPLVND